MANFLKSLFVKGNVTAEQNLISSYSAGDEGGEITLAKPATNSSISTSVTLDIYQNKLRIFESGGTNRGAYLDLTAASAGVGSNLLAGGGGATTLDGLSDVVITSPEEFQGLSYNGTSWVNGHIPLVSYVRNAESTTITTGTCVYLYGATGDHATVKRADNTNDTTSSKTIGVAGADITASNNGPIITRGYVDGIDLSTGYAAGDILWLGTNGAFTKTKPTAPNHLVFIGVVVRATNNGIIYVATQNGYELDEIHNVSLPSPQSGEFLKYNGSLWVADAIDLGTDTVGNYVASLVAGTGISLANNTGEGATPTITNSGVTSINTTLTGNVTGVVTTSDTGTVTSAMIADGTIVNGDINASAGIALSKLASGTSGQVVIANGSGVPTYTTISGDITISSLGVATIAADSVALGTDTTGNYMSGISGTSPVSVSHTPAEGSSATVSLASGYGDTQNPYASKTANYFLAAPNGSAGVPTFRAIVASDIPTLNQNTTGTAANITASSNTTLTSLANLSTIGTLSSGSIPATLLTGTVASARISGSYTGITAVGTLSSLYSTGTVWADKSVGSIYTDANFRAGSGNSAVSIALHASGVAPQFRVGANINTIYCRDYNDGAYITIAAIISNQSSRELKQDIQSWPAMPMAVGAGVNALEIQSGIDIVRQLRPVTYKWSKDEYMSQLPTSPSRASALERLNGARASAGLDPWDGDDVHHKCGRDCDGTEESPCARYLDWDKGQIGFIAEEVGEVVPQAGRIDKDGNFTGIDGLSMAAIAIAAIKELDARLVALENK